MALVTRLSRLFQADFHAVLDQIEEPDLQLRQAVREMQFALDQDQRRLNLLQHEAEQLNSASSGIKTGLHSLDEELDICLNANKDDLARDLIRRKLIGEKQLQAICLQAENIESQTARLARQIDDQVQQLTSVKQKLALLVAADEQTAPGALNQGDAIRSEEVEIALLREKERRVTT